ncbi:MAG: L-rhamnose/proton symporter RhaT [Planctomycetota bacterium]|nr:L-rhamnose/proton symporter RhaT [Planctomycetota bacterium]
MTEANPVLGVFFHWLGGLAAGSFYAPYRAVKKWSWETFWLAGGFFSWIIAPWFFASILSENVLTVLSQATWSTLFWTYLFGAMWGLGGLTFGLSVRYLGMSLGVAVALGYCAAVGTLVPPLYDGTFTSVILKTFGGWVTLAGVVVCLGGIAIAGLAGMSKEREMPEEQKKASVQEFSFKKGILVATFSGILSACLNFGFVAGKPIQDLTTAQGTSSWWAGLPVLIVILLGGFTTNFIWCAILLLKNKTAHQYLSATVRDSSSAEAAAAPERVPMLANYLFCALAGITWYMQFFFYQMGMSRMGVFHFSSWTLHMASIIIFSSLWGLALKEWKGTSSRTRRLLSAGLALLIASTIVIGYGTYKREAEKRPAPVEEPAVTVLERSSRVL